MQQIAHYCMYRPEQRCSVGLFAGDLSKNMSGTAADLLIVSAFRCDYLSTSTSVIGKLARAAGVNFPGLKEHAASLNCDCWLSPMLDEALAEKIGTKRILCYEGGHDNPVESLQTMFSALIQAAVNQSVCLDTLMMPLLCAGDQHADPLRMLREILMATAASFEAGLPVKDVRIVVLPDRADTYSGTFKEIVHQYDPFSSAIDPPTEYDLFLSYCHQDKPLVVKVHTHLDETFGKRIRIFRDEAGGLNPGDVVPDKLKRAIRASRCMTAFYSQSYVGSAACKMEFSLADLRRERKPNAFELRPILIGDAKAITGEFSRVFWEDASGNTDVACAKAEAIARTLIESNPAAGL